MQPPPPPPPLQLQLQPPKLYHQPPNCMAQGPPSSSTTNESFVNSLINELKTIKLSNNHTNINNNHLINSSVDGIMPMLGESSINNKQNNSTWTKTASLWDSPQSPNYSTNIQYHSASSHSNSKESLWASNQSSPNSAHREQLLRQHSSSSSMSSPSSLWENPSSKLSQASLMSKNDSLSSIWQTPPMTQSPVNKISNLWDSPTSFSSTVGNGLFGNSNSSNCSNNSFLNLGNAGQSLLRPQDLSPTDIWSNNSTSNMPSKIKDPVGALWANPTPAPSYTKPNSMITSTPIKSQTTVSPIKPERSPFNNLPQANSANKNGIPSAITSAPASSSCMQLFSDEFINYLNMIN